MNQTREQMLFSPGLILVSLIIHCKKPDAVTEINNVINRVLILFLSAS